MSTLFRKWQDSRCKEKVKGIPVGKSTKSLRTRITEKGVLYLHEELKVTSILRVHPLGGWKMVVCMSEPIQKVKNKEGKTMLLDMDPWRTLLEGSNRGLK